MRIGIDLMGSDASPQVIFDAVLQAAQRLDSSISLVVIGTHSAIKQMGPYNLVENSAKIEFHSVADSISMADEPVAAVSYKTGSSLVIGIRLLKKHYLNAFISAGNTGALVASSTLQLPRLPGIRRPALLASLPTVSGSMAVLDIGGNVSCKPFHLVQYAFMGAAYQRCMYDIPHPKVALLNIGVEPKKGTSFVRQAYQAILEASSTHPNVLRFVGNIEGREVFKGDVDVLVTDGFTGNVFIKTTEGISSFIFDYIQEALDQTPSSAKLKENIHELQRYFNHAEYPGAFLCGVEGVVIKCHGNATVKSIFNGIMGAVRLVEAQIVPKLKSLLG